MNDHIKKEFEKKCMAPEEAMELIGSGDRIYIGTMSSVAYGLCQALSRRISDPDRPLRDITIASGNIVVAPPGMEKPDPEHYAGITTYFMGNWERSCQAYIPVDYTSVHLSRSDLWCRQTSGVNVAFFEVSPPDEDGYMSYGPTGVGINVHLKKAVSRIILQVNRRIPYVCGENNRIHYSEADAIVRLDREPVSVSGYDVNETVRAISGHIVEQIPDGACIQLGLGSLCSAIGFGLREKNDLGVHSEMLSDPMMGLMKNGNITNRNKAIYKGKSVASFAFGSREFYDFMDHNEDLHFLPYTEVTNPVNIAKNDRAISINSALTMDLLGQVCADNLNGQQFSATGGQVDFVRGAQMSKEGKSFIAAASTVNSRKAGRRSRIVSRLPAGSVVTTTRADVQYIATEYGCVDLKPLCMRDRVRAMISLAHPDYRDQLRDEAKEAGMI